MKNTKTSNPKIHIYKRISAAKTDNQDASLDAQESLGRAFAEKNGYEVAGVYEDVKSGGRMDNREGWNSCLKDANKAKGIIWVYSISRASRSSHQFLKLIQDFEKMEVSIVSHSEDLRTDTAAQKMMVGILIQFSEFEKNLAGERTKNALQNLKKEGKKYTNVIPYGKMENADGSKYLNNPAELKIIKRMENLREEGFTYSKISKILNDEKIPTREGKSWHPQVIWKILKRRKKDVEKSLARS